MFSHPQPRFSFLKYVLVSAALLMFPYAARSESQDHPPGSWKLVKSEEGIEIFARPIPGSQRQDVKSSAVFDLPPEKLEAVLRDVEGSVRWMHLLQESREIRVPGEADPLYYFHWDVPWPFDDRDAVCTRKEIREAETGALSFFYQPRPDGYPRQKHRERMKTFECLWRLEPLGPARVRIINELKIKPHGILPASFVNWINQKIAVKTMKSLRKYAAEI